MRSILLTLIFAIWTVSIANATPYSTEILKAASSYTYVREATNRNDHPKIDEWMTYLGLDNKAQIRRTKTGFSWCMGFVQGMYKQVYAGVGKKNPLPRSARCSDVWRLAKKDKYRYQTFTAKDVMIGAVKLKPADVAIWSSNKVDEYFAGHTEVVVKPTTKIEYDSIGGNVGASNDVSQQREQTGVSLQAEKNGGVRYKKRTVKTTSAKFKQEGFIRTLDKK